MKFRKINQSKAQISLYIIVGIILLIGAFIITQKPGQKEYVPEQVLAPSQMGAVKLFIEDCIKEKFPETIKQFGKQGLPNSLPVIEYLENPVAVFFYQDEEMPQISAFEEGFTTILYPQMLGCLYQTTKNFEVDFGDSPLLETRFSEEMVHVELSVPTTIITPGRVEKLDVYNTEASFPFTSVYEIISGLQDSVQEDPTTFPTSAILDLPYDSEVTPYEDGNILIILYTDNILEDKIWEYRFGLRYDPKLMKKEEIQ